jgi:hypothetical protein
MSTTNNQTAGWDKLQMQAIELLDVAMQMPQGYDPEKQDFDFNVNFDYQLNLQAEALINIARVAIRYGKNEGGDKELPVCASATISCVYHLPGLDGTAVIQKDGSFTLPEGLTVACQSHTIGAVRGLMFAQLKGTVLHHVVLPLLPFERR